MDKLFEKILAAVVLAAAVIVAGGTVLLRTTAEPAKPPLETMPAGPSVTAEPTPPPDGTPVPTQTPEQTPEPTPDPTPTPEPEYYLMHFVGDCTLDSVDWVSDGYQAVVKTDYAYPFAKTVQYFENDDFTFANLEVSLTESNAAVADKQFVFKAPPAYAQIMTAGGVEFVSLANNHVLDYGQQGYADTKAAVEAAGLAYAGRDEWTIYELERGLRIGVYAGSFVSVDKIKAGVTAVKEAGADFVIAALHWGDEGSYQVNADQIAQGHAAVDAGADFVYGSHPHTLQPIEEYKGVYITYSMGNWSFGGNNNPRDKDTLILEMVVAQQADGTVTVEEFTVIPCACSGLENSNNYQPVPYEEGSEAYQRTLSKLDGTFTGQNLTINYGYGANE